jgi:hypothetical protein
MPEVRHRTLTCVHLLGYYWLISIQPRQSYPGAATRQTILYQELYLKRHINPLVSDRCGLLLPERLVRRMR